MLATGGCGTTAESYVKRYFIGSMGEAATGIQHALWGLGRRVQVVLWKRKVRERQEKVFWYARTYTDDVLVGE